MIAQKEISLEFQKRNLFIYHAIISYSKKFHTEMFKRIESQIRKRISESQSSRQANKLCLDNIQIKIFSPNLKKLIESLVNLEYLTMNNCSLKSLDNFPHLPKLFVLQMSDNELQGEDLNKLRHVPLVSFLTLDNNHISKISNIKLLNCLPQLQILQVHANPLVNSPDYRETLFEYLPNLKSIDCQDKLGNKVQQEDPSQYISVRQHRSFPNFDDVGVNEDETGKNKQQINQEEQNICMKRSALNTQGGSFYRPQQTSRRPPTDIMSIRTGFKEEQEDQQYEQPIMGDFLKKKCKRQ